MFAELGDHGGLAWTDGLMAFVRFYQGRVQEARELGTQVLRESERRADRWGQGMMLLVLAAIDLWEGRTSRAEEYSQRSVALLRSLGDSMGLEQALGVRSRALLMLGRVAEGNAAIAEAASLVHAERFADHARMASAVVLGDTSAFDDLEALAATMPDDGSDGFSQVESQVVVSLGLAQLGELDRGRRAHRGDTSARPDERVRRIGLARSSPRRAAIADVRRAAGRSAVRQPAQHVPRPCLRPAGPRAHLAGAAADLRSASRRCSTPPATSWRRRPRCLAEASALVSVGDPAGSAVEAEADRRWTEMGVDPVGWRALFALATDRSSGRA